MCLTTGTPYSFSVLKNSNWLSFRACVIGKFHPVCLSAYSDPSSLLSAELIGDFPVIWYHLSRSLHPSVCVCLSHTRVDSHWNQTLPPSPIYEESTYQESLCISSVFNIVISGLLLCCCQDGDRFSEVYPCAFSNLYGPKKNHKTCFVFNLFINQ